MARSAERRQMTVMFVDMVASTKRLQNCDPEEFFEFIVEYQTLVKKCVAKYGGNVARLIGDGVLIYFGWPQVHEKGLELLRSGWEEFTRTEARINQVFYMAELAECNLRIGNLEAAKGAVETGFELMSQYGESNFEAELHRLKAEIMVADGSYAMGDIEREFRAAIKIARSQGARIFEMRASIGLEKINAHHSPEGKSENWTTKILSNFADLAQFHELKSMTATNRNAFADYATDCENLQ